MTLLDLAVLGVVLGGTTLLGKGLAGRQTDLVDFYRGGRRLPWWAVSASIVATEISAVTFISLPAAVFRPGGDISYLQIVLFGYLPARVAVGLFVVPAYFRHDIYSPYDFMGIRLGEPVRRTMTALFSLGGVLAQSSRVYLTAVVLEVLLRPELESVAGRLGISTIAVSVLLVAVVAILWTWMGGIATVVWTDAVLFVLFLVGAAICLGEVAAAVPGGLGATWSRAAAAGKLAFFDLSADPTRPYTLWAALLGATWGGIVAFGTDQLVAQRLFCCRDAGEARKAVIWSAVGSVTTFLVLLVGAGLWVYYSQLPMDAESAARVAERADRVLPLFVLDAVPAGLRGLVLAGALAAAISSLDSILAALAQTTQSVLFGSRGEIEAGAAGGRSEVRRSRVLVLVWGLVLVAVALGIEQIADRYAVLLDLSLAMAGYTGGALLAGLLLALRPCGRNGRGLVWSGPMSVMVVVAVVWHAGWVPWTLALAWVLLVGSWVVYGPEVAGARRGAGLVVLTAGGLLAWTLWRWAVAADGSVLAWPWYVPLGGAVATVTGWLLSGPADGSPASSSGEPVPYR